ncbi:MAG: MFS transporter [Thermoplasmata archaeon]
MSRRNPSRTTDPSRLGPSSAPVRTRRVAFATAGYGLWILLLGGTIPTPLYPLYEDRLHFPPSILTLIFAVYAIGVLAGLLFLARASDSIGRRPMILLGIATAVVSAIVFIFASSVPELLLGRVLSGLSVGLVTSTATAALTELEPSANRTHASSVAATLNLMGLASGPLLAGLLAQYAPAPTELVFVVDIALLVPATVGILLLPETAPQRGLGIHWTLPRFSIPREVRPAFALASVGAFAGFAVAGLFSALTGSFLIVTLGIHNLGVVGIAVFLLFASAAFGQLLWTRAHLGKPMEYGLALLLAGVVVNLASLVFRSALLFWPGILVMGAGFGVGFLGSLRLLNEEAPAARRGELLGEYFIVAYAGLSIPVVGVGVLEGFLGLTDAAAAFSVFVIALLFVGLYLLRSQVPLRDSGSRG